MTANRMGEMEVLVPTWAGAEEVSAKEDDISLATIGIGQRYSISDKWGRIDAQFTNQSTLLVTYTDLSNTSRYISIYVTEAGKEFPVENIVVKAGKAKSVSYPISASGYSNVVITMYRHTSTSSNSGQINPIEGRLPN